MYRSVLSEVIMWLDARGRKGGESGRDWETERKKRTKVWESRHRRAREYSDKETNRETKASGDEQQNSPLSFNYLDSKHIHPLDDILFVAQSRNVNIMFV